jgi:hypothetical protein
MKVVISLDLSDEDDSEKYKLITQAQNMNALIYEYAMWLRGFVKHGDPKEVDAEIAQEKFWELAAEYKVNII